MCTIGIPKKRKRKENKIFKEIMAENSPNLLNLHIQNNQQTPGQTNIKKSANRNIMLKMLKAKDKEKILKAAREKMISWLTRELQ